MNPIVKNHASLSRSLLKNVTLENDVNEKTSRRVELQVQNTFTFI